jgi:hypothetical protein
MNVGTLIFRIFLAIISIPLLWICLTAFEPEIVLFQAKRIAGDRPYCIVVFDTRPNLPTYKAAVNRSELTFSALVAHVYWLGGSGAGRPDTYYALLILKNPDEMRNWSKLYLNFENDVEPTQSSVYRRDFNKICTPVGDYASSIQ